MRVRNAALMIIGANIVMYLLQRTVEGLTENLMLVPSEVVARPWIIVTSMFLHSPQSIAHLFFNMYALFIFGPLIEHRIGTNKFVAAYFASGILAALVWATFMNNPALGASGAVMGVIGLTIMLLPDLKILLFFIIPMSMRTAGVVFALIDIVGLFNPHSSIANLAHLAGLGVGLLIGWSIVRERKRSNRQRVIPARKKSKQASNDTSSNNTFRRTIEIDEDSFNEYLRTGRV